MSLPIYQLIRVYRFSSYELTVQLDKAYRFSSIELIVHQVGRSFPIMARKSISDNELTNY
ncbi:hypothetical protein F383_00410 [Gossypium arboreum]|uniref:Uncharacterized protein n=1 Tax=Gossypium arboreum TaxID=29729 RepID=A0A0B0NMI1_GOSAR|nr:hypothetical protein F383_00410 [Gossypium arboreum]